MGPMRMNVFGAAKKKNTKSKNHFITLEFLPRLFIKIYSKLDFGKSDCILAMYSEYQIHVPDSFLFLGEYLYHHSL